MPLIRILLNDDEARRLSAQLRRSDDRLLRYRRQIAGLSLVSSGAMAVVVLYQLGLIKRLPEPPLALLDADAVDAAPEAYARFETPDAALGLLSYALTLVLAAAGGEDRAGTRPWLPLLLLGKTLLDATEAGRLTVDQWIRHRAFCLWCLMGAAATMGTVPLALPEARAALQQLLDRRLNVH